MSSKNLSTRNRILSATRHLLESDGASAVRMSDIAKVAKISRQALYLHFPNRAELLVATVRYLDETNNMDKRLEKSRAATVGTDRLTEWIDVWGNYIPEIYGVANALIAMRTTDEEARIAWDDRMAAVRHGCAAVIEALERDGDLTTDLSTTEATDMLANLVSLHSWEHLVARSNWSQSRYIQTMHSTAAKVLLART